MATEDSLKELDDWLARQKEMYEAGYISAKQLNEAQMDHAAGIRGYTATLKQSMAQLGTSSKETAKTMLKGQESSAAFGKTVEAGADAVASYTAKFGPAGKALGMLAKGMAALNSAALKQSKDLFEQYQKLSQVGVVGGKAMDEVYEKMREFGYTQDQLGSLNRVLTENSKTLGKFYGSALEGSRVMGRASAGFAEQRESLRRMGLSVDDLNDAMAGYMAQEGAMGKLRGKTDKELTAGTIAYLKELDQITKLTGMSRQEQQDVREQALNIETFYAGLQDLDDKAREQAMKAYNIALTKGGPKMAAEFAANFNGVITGSTDVMMATGGQSMKYFSKEFFAKGGTAEESMKGVAGAVDPAVMEVTKGLNQIGGSFGSNLRTLTEFKEGVATITTDVTKVAKEQKDQVAGIDSATASQAKIAENQLKTGQKTADFVNIMVPTSTKMFKFATDVTEWASRALPGASENGILGFFKRDKSGTGAAPAGGGGGGSAPASAPAGGGSAPAGGGGGRGGGSASPQSAPASAPQTAPASAPVSPAGNAPTSRAPEPHGTSVASGTQPGSPTLTKVSSKLGQSASVNKEYAPQFQQLIDYLDGVGYKITSLGGYIDRDVRGKPGVKSVHGHGGAIDINPGANPMGAQLVTDMPENISAISKQLGLGWGGNWSSVKDAMHFSVASHEGGKIKLSEGGVAVGPNSGYPATLHGEEAVIPLNNGAGNFVKLFEEMAETNAQMVQLLEETLDLQESIASATKNTADSSGKMLQYAQG